VKIPQKYRLIIYKTRELGIEDEQAVRLNQVYKDEFGSEPRSFGDLLEAVRTSLPQGSTISLGRNGKAPLRVPGIEKIPYGFKTFQHQGALGHPKDLHGIFDSSLPQGISHPP